ncbi:hypothetical protein EV690_1832 [Celerinatantimonas diazotrophica]|uniref:Uncharacterized protein n=1 Tax=Celerinatantimonas diazotrophica TaxID=412034 RepID=A0A4R1K276_9GAMM|nr:hypothetical protein EV690_1832 [Celerinatantimonas diazotrophica]CAG9297804.1 hypothetical protein CEDIAZO_02995 [Celerinatantimonas diazotrophica]
MLMMLFNESIEKITGIERQHDERFSYRFIIIYKKMAII